jgi:hypothetical protein
MCCRPFSEKAASDNNAKHRKKVPKGQSLHEWWGDEQIWRPPVSVNPEMVDFGSRESYRKLWTAGVARLRRGSKIFGNTVLSQKDAISGWAPDIPKNCLAGLKCPDNDFTCDKT